ncbi:hypothetical protein KSP40_PGU009154 [Platanthera guangdongensis]|uniref:Uncharacterized protein n=1 Tax=Platanthera guangdongensis TaxID=2320717 RepID=A0ABR2N0I8_9ASPA
MGLALVGSLCPSGESGWPAPLAYYYREPREEVKLNKVIIRIIHSGNTGEELKANSSQSVAVGEHKIYVGFHEEVADSYEV